MASILKRGRGRPPKIEEQRPDEQSSKVNGDSVAPVVQPADFSMNPDAAPRNSRKLQIEFDPETGKLSDSMRESTLEKFKKIVTHPDNKEKLFGKEDTEKLPGTRKQVTAEACQTPWVFIGTAFQAAVSSRFQGDQKTVSRLILGYTPDELHRLAAQTAECVNYYADQLPQWLLDILEKATGPLAQLVETVLAIHVLKIMALKAALANPQMFLDQVKAQAVKAQANGTVPQAPQVQ